MQLIDELFEWKPGYVLEFSDRTYAEFFREEVRTDIDDAAYRLDRNSKGQRFRTFLKIAQSAAVAKALTALWDYRAALLRRSGAPDPVTEGADQLSAIIERLGGKPLQAAKRQSPPASARTAPDAGALEKAFMDLSILAPQPHRLSAVSTRFATTARWLRRLPQR